MEYNIEEDLKVNGIDNNLLKDTSTLLKGIVKSPNCLKVKNELNLIEVHTEEYVGGIVYNNHQIKECFLFGNGIKFSLDNNSFIIRARLEDGLYEYCGKTFTDGFCAEIIYYDNDAYFDISKTNALMYIENSLDSVYYILEDMGIHPNIELLEDTQIIHNCSERKAFEKLISGASEGLLSVCELPNRIKDLKKTKLELKK